MNIDILNTPRQTTDALPGGEVSMFHLPAERAVAVEYIADSTERSVAQIRTLGDGVVAFIARAAETPSGKYHDHLT